MGKRITAYNKHSMKLLRPQGTKVGNCAICESALYNGDKHFYILDKWLCRTCIEVSEMVVKGESNEFNY